MGIVLLQTNRERENCKLQNSKSTLQQYQHTVGQSAFPNSETTFAILLNPFLSFKSMVFLPVPHSFLMLLSPGPGFICCRNFGRIIGHIQLNKWHIIRFRKRIWGIHKQRRFHHIGLCRISYSVRIFGSTGTRRWETGKLYVIQLVSKHMFVSSYRFHLRTSWHKGAWPILPCSLITLIVIVKNIIMVGWCKLQKGNELSSARVQQSPKENSEALLRPVFKQTLRESMSNAFKAWERERERERERGSEMELYSSPGGPCHGKSHLTLRRVQGFLSNHGRHQYLHQHTLCMEMHRDGPQQQ